MSQSEETKGQMESAGDFSEEDNDNCCSSNSNNSDTKRSCVDCGTSKTPLWRGGPAGPKSLCNACGIKSRKKRQAALGIRPAEKKKNRRTNNSNPNLGLAAGNLKNCDPTNCNNTNDSKGIDRFLDLGFKVPAMKRSVVGKKRLWKKLGEEERAAVLLMALSCGFVYA